MKSNTSNKNKEKNKSKLKVENTIDIEELFKKLDLIVKKMKNNKSSLNESLESYKKGVEYLKIIKNILEKTKKEMEVLSE